jgi:hypothetical protein
VAAWLRRFRSGQCEWAQSYQWARREGARMRAKNSRLEEPLPGAAPGDRRPMLRSSIETLRSTVLRACVGARAAAVGFDAAPSLRNIRANQQFAVESAAVREFLLGPFLVTAPLRRHLGHNPQSRFLRPRWPAFRSTFGARVTGR